MLRLLTTLAAATLLANPAFAEDPAGTLQRIAARGKMIIGYVPDAPPMSYKDADGEVVGYSIDLCRRVTAAVQEKLGLDELDVEYVPITAPEDRLRAVETGRVDLECGATTVTLSRRERVDFSMMTFITGGAVLSTAAAPITTTSDIDGKRIAVIAETTTEHALKRFVRTNEFKISIEYIATHEEGIRLLDEGKVDGYASDRTMLIGQAIRAPDGDYRLTRSAFSFEQYGLMLQRGDTDFRLLADRALARLFGTARILRLYHDWFGRHGEPLPPIVKAMYEFQAIAE